jgi:hypothetical protein
MNPFAWFAIALLAGGFTWFCASEDTRTRQYVADCDQQGGRVVRMYLQQHMRWMQCVHGLEVVTLPQDR